MFELVADVKKYPEFVPLCSALTVKSSNEKDDGAIVLVADMTVAYKIIRETFTSRVTLDRPNLDWTVLAQGCGVDAGRATSLDELAHQFKRGLSAHGPYLIELVM